MQNEFSSSSNSGGGGSSAPGHSAAAAAASPSPVLIRPAELSNLIYCCSKLEQQRPQLLAAAAAGLVLDLYACSTLELQRLIWGLAHARVNPGDAWLLNFCKAAQAKLFDCSPAKLSALVRVCGLYVYVCVGVCLGGRVGGRRGHCLHGVRQPTNQSDRQTNRKHLLVLCTCAPMYMHMHPVTAAHHTQPCPHDPPPPPPLFSASLGPSH